MVPRAIETSFVQWNLLHLQKNQQVSIGFGRANVRFPPQGCDWVMIYKWWACHICLFTSGYLSVSHLQNSPSRSCQLTQQWGILNILVQLVNTCQETFTDTWLDTCWYIWAKIYHDTTKKIICLHFRPLGPRTSLALFQFLAWAPTFGWLSGVGVGMELMW